MTDTNEMREAIKQIILDPQYNTASQVADAILALLATDRAAGVGEVGKVLSVIDTFIEASTDRNVRFTAQRIRETVATLFPPAASPPAPADASGEVERVIGWLEDICTLDLSEIVADGGVTAGMVAQQEARTVQLGRLKRARAALNPTAGTK